MSKLQLLFTIHSAFVMEIGFLDCGALWEGESTLVEYSYLFCYERWRQNNESEGISVQNVEADKTPLVRYTCCIEIYVYYVCLLLYFFLYLSGIY